MGSVEAGRVKLVDLGIVPATAQAPWRVETHLRTPPLRTNVTASIFPMSNAEQGPLSRVTCEYNSPSQTGERG